jgi:hypothetical protein
VHRKCLSVLVCHERSLRFGLRGGGIRENVLTEWGVHLYLKRF